MPTYAKGCKPPRDLARRAALSRARDPLFLALVGLTPSAYDCRTKGFVTPIKDQGQCGDCWNFSGTGAAEMAAIVAGLGTAAAVNWSEQSVLDCGSNGGCNGDWPETALEQAKNSGLANTRDYPYVGGPSGRCANVPHPNTVTDYGYVGSSDAVPGTDEIKAAMLTHGPIAIAVAADDAFQAYTSGIFRDSGSTAIDHAVILVGWQDYDADHPAPAGSTATGYWILRNSWNTSWGESGYMRIEYGANQVGFGAMWVSCGSPAPDPAPAPQPGPAPTPTPAGTTLTGSTAPTTVTVTVPLGHGQVAIPIPALPVTVQAAPGCPVLPGAIDWAAVLPLILQYGSEILPVVLADLGAGKTWVQILADIGAAVLTRTRVPKPCGC